MGGAAFAFALMAVLGAVPPDRPVQLGVGAGTNFPIDVSAQVRLELPGRIQLGTSFGFVPGPYFRLINDTLVRYDAYSREEGDLIEAALDRALVWRSRLGWRPVRDSGFYFAGTYTLLGLGGRTTAGEVLAIVLGIPVPEGIDFDARATSRLHQLGGELGWQWDFGERLGLELALGGGLTFQANTEVTPETDAATRVLLSPFTALAEDNLNDNYRRYFHSAYVSVRGYFEVL